MSRQTVGQGGLAGSHNDLTNTRRKWFIELADASDFHEAIEQGENDERSSDL